MLTVGHDGLYPDLLELTPKQITQGFVTVVLQEFASGRGGEGEQDAQESQDKQEFDKAQGLLLIPIHGAIPFARMMRPS